MTLGERIAQKRKAAGVLEGDFKVDPIEIREYAVSLYEDGKKLCDYQYLPEQMDVIDDSFTVIHLERPEGIVVNLSEHEYVECVTVTDQYGRMFTTAGEGHWLVDTE